MSYLIALWVLMNPKTRKMVNYGINGIKSKFYIFAGC